MKWEFDILYALQKIHQPVLDHIMTGLSTIGNAGIFWIVLGLALCIPKKYRKIGIQMVISMAITFIIGNLILKNLIARERPCWLDTQIALLIKSPKDYSFPSGHSMNGFAASIALLPPWRRTSFSAGTAGRTGSPPRPAPPGRSRTPPACPE